MLKDRLADDIFISIYADNYTNINYSKLIKFHNANNATMTLAMFKCDDSWTRGVVVTDENGKISKMVKKPPREEFISDLVNGGIYVCNPKILDYIPEGFSDYGFDVIPALIAAGEPVYGFYDDHVILDIGTPERLQAVRDFVAK